MPEKTKKKKKAQNEDLEKGAHRKTGIKPSWRSDERTSVVIF